MTQLGEKHLTATVFIVSDEKKPRVLLVNHKKLGKWMPPGGHKEFNENPYENVLREALEETGIDIAPYIPKPQKIDDHTYALPRPYYFYEEVIGSYKGEPPHFHIDCGYAVTVPFQEVQLREEDHVDLRWFALDEIEDIPLFDNVRASIVELLK